MSSVEVAPVPVDAGKLLTALIHDLDVPDEVTAFQPFVRFEGGLPFLPVPHKSVSQA